jgi:hypothetical protein
LAADIPSSFEATGTLTMSATGSPSIYRLSSPLLSPPRPFNPFLSYSFGLVAIFSNAIVGHSFYFNSMTKLIHQETSKKI